MIHILFGLLWNAKQKSGTLASAGKFLLALLLQLQSVTMHEAGRRPVNVANRTGPVQESMALLVASRENPAEFHFN